MSPIKFLAILFSAAVAHSTVDILSIGDVYDSVLTLQGSNPTATTYVHHCLPMPSECVLDINPISYPIPTPSGCAAFPQGQRMNPDLDLCPDYTLIQGPSTHEFHMTANASVMSMTVDASCSWTGQMSTADLTCTLTSDGQMPMQSSEIFGPLTETALRTSPVPVSFSYGVRVTTTTFKRDEVESSSFVMAATVVTPTDSPMDAPDAPQSTEESSGLAPAGALPTGLGGFLGGAAVVLVAAVAL